MNANVPNRPLRILIQGINFAPELTGIGKYTGEMVAWLTSRGHEVRVVTAPPYYPHWKIQAGYSAARYTREQILGAMVWRSPLWVPAKQSGGNRLVHLLSFAAGAAPLMLRQAIWAPDVVIAVAPALVCAPVAWLTARACGARAWLHIQDFEVEAAFELGLLNGRISRTIALSLERALLRRFDRVSAISERMVERLNARGVSRDRQVLFLNWVDTEQIRPELHTPYRAELEIPAERVVALYSGNMGEKQGLDILVEAARTLAPREDILFVFCGDGAARPRLEASSKQLQNIRWLPLQPADRLNALLNVADIHLLPQRAGVADLVMPSKLTGMLASGRPVVTTAASATQLAKVVKTAGLVADPGDSAMFAEHIAALADNPSTRARLGQAARDYALEHLGKEAVLRDLESALLAAVGQRRTAAVVTAPSSR